MSYEELLEFLSIDSGSEFEYFENFADLLESEEEISEEALYRLFEEAPTEGLLDIIENYFEDLLNALPDDSTDIYTLVESLKMSFIGMLEATQSDRDEDDTALVHFCDELNSFREWYCISSKTECRNMTKGRVEVVPLRDALVLARLEKLDGDKYQYDFRECLDYTPEEYVLTYGDLARTVRDENSEASDGYGNIDDFESFDNLEEKYYN